MSEQAKEQVSQVDKYQAIEQKLGVSAVDKEEARFDGKITLKKDDSLGQKLLEHYGNTPDGRSKMISMLVQLTKVGFNVDYVQKGETFEFKGKDVVVKDESGKELLRLDLDVAEQQVKDKTRQALGAISAELEANPEDSWHSGVIGGTQSEPEVANPEDSWHSGVTGGIAPESSGK